MWLVATLLDTPEHLGDSIHALQSFPFFDTGLSNERG